MPTPLQLAAAEYAAAGLHLLALTGKKPNGRVHGERWSWDDSIHGTPESDADRAALDAAFSEERGTTGIAILIPEGFLVADVDSDRAAQLLLDLGFVAHEDTVVAKTKNGLHIWFVAPGQAANRWVGDGQQPDPGRTLLFKGFGGYVVAPPSLHFDKAGVVDGQYEWVTPLVEGGRLFMPDPIPVKALEKFTLTDQFREMEPPKEKMAHFTAHPQDGVEWWRWPIEWNYATEGLEQAIKNAADGNQNNIIHWAAMVAKEEGVPYDVAMERLMAAALRGGHPRNRAHDTIKGAYKRGARG